jgi:molybdate transport system substrate-binding protein
MRKAVLATALAAALLLPLAAQAAQRVQHGSIFPPWQHGENNDAAKRGLSFTVPQVDDLADFHGDVSAPKLVLYVGGNYFFAMAPLAAVFEQQHPEFKGRIYWELFRPASSKSRSRLAGPLPPAT